MQCNNHGYTRMTKESFLYFATEVNVREKVMLIIEARKWKTRQRCIKVLLLVFQYDRISQKTLLVLIEIRGTAISFINYLFI